MGTGTISLNNHLDSLTVPDVKKIAVLRANALGDFLFIIPALDALHATYPDATFVLLGKAWHAAFLRDRPGVIDHVDVIPGFRGVGEAIDYQENREEIEAFFARMRDEHFDLAFQIYGGGGYSNPFVRRLGARLTVGLKTPEAEPLDRWVPYIYYQHEVLRYLEVVSLVGTKPVTLVPHIELTAQDYADVTKILPLETISKPLIVLHPGASEKRRRWSPQHFATVGNALAKDGATIIITGNDNERQLAQTVADHMEYPVHNVAGQLLLGGLAALLAHSQLLIANDTGPLHLAEAVGSSSVGIYWVGNMITAASTISQKRRYGISWQLHCPICGKENIPTRSCGHQVSFVDRVSPEEIIQAAHDLLAQSR